MQQITDTGILVLSIIIILVCTLFVQHFGIAGVTEGVGDTIEEPTAWDWVVTFTGTFWDIMTFNITGLAIAFSMTFWLLSFLDFWIFIRLVRGV